MINHPDQHTQEAKAKRAQRVAARRQPGDPLRERARIAAFWVLCNNDNKHYGLVHSRKFFNHPGYQRLLAPKVRSHIQAKNDARRRSYADELRRSVQRAANTKALAMAAPLPLFEQAAA